MSYLYHPSFFQHIDYVRIHYLRNAVQDDDNRTIFLDRVKAVLYLLGRDSVETRGRFAHDSKVLPI